MGNSDTDSEDSDLETPPNRPAPRPVIIRAAAKPKSLAVDVDDFFSFNSRSAVVAKKSTISPKSDSPQTQQRPSYLTNNPLLSLVKKQVLSESESETDESTVSRQDRSPSRSPVKRSRVELTPPPPEMPHVKLFSAQPKPKLVSLELDSTGGANRLEPEIIKSLRAAKTQSKIIDDEEEELKINIRVVLPDSLGNPIIIQYNPNTNFEQLIAFLCNRFNWNVNDLKILYKDVPINALSTPKTLRMLDGEQIKVMSNSDYSQMMQMHKEQQRNLLDGKVSEDVFVLEDADDLRVDLTADDDDNDDDDYNNAAAAGEAESYQDTNDEEEEGEWLLLKITNQQQQTSKYKLRPDTLVKDLILQYKRQTGLADGLAVELEFDGESLEPSNRISAYDCEDGDQLTARHLN